MACEGATLSNGSVLDDVAKAFMEGINDSIREAGLSEIPRRFVGMGPVPSEDCCPDLVVWISNVRPYDTASPDTLQENRLLQHWGIAFDVNVRLGLCYFEADDSGGPLDTATLTDWSGQINKYGHAAYIRFLSRIGSIPLLSGCSVNITPQSMFPYQSGGCGGWQYAITVSLI